MKQFCHHLLKYFKGKMDLSISIGVSNSYRQITDLPEAYRQAFQAAVIGREHFGENKVVFYDSVYFFQKLRQMGVQQETQEICLRFLNPILEYDEKYRTDLMNTLKCLLANSTNTMDAAKEMYVHKNTILQRKSKIIELLGYSPFEMPHLLNFLIIIDIWNKESM